MSIVKGITKVYWVHHCEGLPAGVTSSLEAEVQGDYVNFGISFCPQCGEALPRFVSKAAEKRHHEAINRFCSQGG